MPLSTLPPDIIYRFLKELHGSDFQAFMLTCKHIFTIGKRLVARENKVDLEVKELKAKYFEYKPDSDLDHAWNILVLFTTSDPEHGLYHMNQFNLHGSADSLGRRVNLKTHFGTMNRRVPSLANRIKDFLICNQKSFSEYCRRHGEILINCVNDTPIEPVTQIFVPGPYYYCCRMDYLITWVILGFLPKLESIIIDYKSLVYGYFLFQQLISPESRLHTSRPFSSLREVHLNLSHSGHFDCAIDLLDLPWLETLAIFGLETSKTELPVVMTDQVNRSIKNLVFFDAFTPTLALIVFFNLCQALQSIVFEASSQSQYNIDRIDRCCSCELNKSSCSGFTQYELYLDLFMQLPKIDSNISKNLKSMVMGLIMPFRPDSDFYEKEKDHSHSMPTLDFPTLSHLQFDIVLSPSEDPPSDRLLDLLPRSIQVLRIRIYLGTQRFNDAERILMADFTPQLVDAKRKLPQLRLLHLILVERVILALDLPVLKTKQHLKQYAITELEQRLQSDGVTLRVEQLIGPTKEGVYIRPKMQRLPGGFKSGLFNEDEFSDEI